MILGRREQLDPDHRLLTMRLHERGLWMADVRHADHAFIVCAGTERIEISLRRLGESAEEWVTAAVDCVAAELDRLAA